MMLAIFIYLVLINLVSFCFMYVDKQRAIKNQWRIPELTLLLLCLAGGFIGTFLAMKYVRHKTKHLPFHACVIFSAILWLFAIPFGYLKYVA
ncbi:hypothetical protein B0187_03565 [Haemophilus paracuniculus]|uniref:DUF1294 domain-containing protein n=1 Tax=Haemophilus paracuniculus TaxID=734 RepID=A0A1T0AU72_9PAST|nr:DUF1294 domain-containing protein [Haemophilus paracuniculus]OOR99895.1 hypothetical protein B0187_03565 [Haemophilus paracuniculus]